MTGASEAGMRSKVLIVGAFRFPKWDAPGLRVLGLARAVRASGSQVDVVGLPPTAEGASGGDNPECFEGISHWAFDDAGIPARRGGSAAARYIRSGKETLAWLGTRRWDGLRAVIGYGGSALFVMRLRALCRAKNVPLVLDCVEWSDVRHSRGVPLGAKFIENSLRMRLIVPRVANITCISTYLAQYYKTRGCRVMVVPPLIDAADVEWEEARAGRSEDREGLELAFAGAPHRERWDLILRGLEQLEAGGIGATIRLFGGREEDLIGALGHSAQHWPRWRRFVRFEGWVERLELLRALANCDAGVLLRDDARWSRACFPSKVPEMLRLGLPIIFNRTSDLVRLLEDGRHGFVVRELSAEGFAGAVARLASHTGAERMALRQQAALHATAVFDYRAYSEPVSRFIEECSSETGSKGG